MPIDLTPRHSKKLKTSVALPFDLTQEAHAIAAKHNISLSEYITRLLRMDLADRKLPMQTLEPSFQGSGKLIEFNGKKLTWRGWALETGIPRFTLLSRRSYGWSLEQILTTPVQRRHRQTTVP
jgi:hypothetical protein